MVSTLSSPLAGTGRTRSWRTTPNIVLSIVLSAATLLVGAGTAGATAPPPGGPPPGEGNDLVALQATAADPGPTAPSVTAAGSASGTAVFTGYGQGHGRGMSQYGAYGYAVDYGWSYQQMLAHYYGNTRLAGDGGNGIITVRLLGEAGAPSTTFIGPGGITVNGVRTGTLGVRVQANAAAGTFALYTNIDTCGNTGWKYWKTLTPAATGLVVRANPPAGATDPFLKLCNGTTGYTAYRGEMRPLYALSDGVRYPQTINAVRLDDYLRGVVPHEMPAGWGSAGGGRGQQALKTQAVAARSYALKSDHRSYAKICDTTVCQAYEGVYQVSNGSRHDFENPLSSTAVTDTTGQILRLTSGGDIAYAEFGASSGGYTAGGQFPAVVDAGDAVSINPYHPWVQSYSYAAVAAALGLPDLASLTITSITSGPRHDVNTVRAVSSAGVSTFTGDEVRRALGLPDRWFSISGLSRDQATSTVRALYMDLLSRPADSTGLNTWVDRIVGGTPVSSVALSLAAARERVQRLIGSVYQAGLHRTADASGLAAWTAQLSASHRLIDVQVAILSSGESLGALGQGRVRPWLAALYPYLLGRTASSSELTAWEGRVSSGGRAAAVRSMAGSREALSLAVDRYYRAMLGRSTDASGQARFVPLMATTGQFTLPGYIAGSSEYTARAGSRFPAG